MFTVEYTLNKTKANAVDNKAVCLIYNWEVFISL